ncbi:uncharacterized protein [Rutidosis leptorrhynchoides]|uniref:uncharacterized protein n=1 Tax=Rutidosis leptorrhynchoides TaxID=125765 RepID=UPI003A995F5B
MEEWCTKSGRKVPSLFDLCAEKVVDDVRYLGDLVETNQHLLERILPHCTVDQLIRIEDSNVGQDLSPVTDKLWKNFYTQQFGSKNARLVVDRMKQMHVSFRWRQLYEAKLKEVKEAQQKSFKRVKQLYKKEDAKIKTEMNCFQLNLQLFLQVSCSQTVIETFHQTVGVQNIMYRKSKAKLKEVKEAQQKSFKRVKQLYKKEDAIPSFDDRNGVGAQMFERRYQNLNFDRAESDANCGGLGGGRVT